MAKSMPGMVGRMLLLPRCVSGKQRTSHWRLLHISANKLCLAVEKPSTLDDMTVSAGPRKGPRCGSCRGIVVMFLLCYLCVVVIGLVQLVRIYPGSRVHMYGRPYHHPSLDIICI